MLLGTQRYGYEARKGISLVLGCSVFGVFFGVVRQRDMLGASVFVWGKVFRWTFFFVMFAMFKFEATNHSKNEICFPKRLQVNIVVFIRGNQGNP